MDMAAVWPLQLPKMPDALNQSRSPDSQRAISDESAALADSSPVCGSAQAWLRMLSAAISRRKPVMGPQGPHPVTSHHQPGRHHRDSVPIPRHLKRDRRIRRDRHRGTGPLPGGTATSPTATTGAPSTPTTRTQNPRLTGFRSGRPARWPWGSSVPGSGPATNGLPRTCAQRRHPWCSRRWSATPEGAQPADIRRGGGCGNRHIGGGRCASSRSIP